MTTPETTPDDGGRTACPLGTTPTPPSGPSLQQLAEASARDHTGRIGASRAAAVLGKDRFCTPVQAWLEIRGEPVERKAGLEEPAHWGTVLEDVVGREGYTRETGRKLARVNRTLAHPKHEFITCHLDRRVLSDRPARIYQGKCRHFMARQDWGPQGTDQVPHAEMIQVCVEMELAHHAFRGGVRFGDVGVLFGGNKFRWFELERDAELCQAIIAMLAEWHAVHIVEGREPEAMSEEDCKALWRKTTRAQRSVMPADEEILRELVKVDQEMADRKKRRDVLRFQLRKALGRDEEIVALMAGDGPPKRKAVAAWPQVWEVDEERLEADHAELAAKYRKQQIVVSYDRKQFEKDHPKLWAEYRTTQDRGNMRLTNAAKELYGTNGQAK